MLDQDIVNLAKAIRQQETGNRAIKGASGELASRYQYMPATWKSTASKYLGDANAPLTLENENKATYLKLSDWKKQGYNPAQIASMWNSGKPEWEGKVGVNSNGVKYDVPKYVESVYSIYKKNKAETTPPPVNNFTDSGINVSTGKENFIEGASKAAGNIIPSTVDTAKGLLSAVNPVNTVKNIFQLPVDIAAAKDEGVTGAQFVGELIKSIIPNWIQNGLSAAGGYIASGLTKDQGKKQEYLGYADTKLQQAQKSLVDNPFGEALGTALLGEMTMGKPSPKLKPAVKTNLAGDLTTGAASQFTGLSPETIKTVIKAPEKFTAENMIEYGRKNLAEDISTKVNAKILEKTETGAGYNIIRQSKDTVVVPESLVRNVIEKDFGLKVEPRVGGGFGLSKTMNTKPISPNILTGLQGFIDQYGLGGKYTAEQFLNMRGSLTSLANFDKLNPTGADIISRNLRSVYDVQGKSQIKGLEKLDAKYSAEIREYKQLKKDLLERDVNGGYKIKENISSKITNATNKGREAYLRRLEDLKPGITQEINIVRAMEDIQRASGQKVGAYASRILPAAAGGAIAGFGGAVIGFILSTPTVFIPILRNFGKAANFSKASIELIVEKVTKGKPLTATEKLIVRDAITFTALQIPKENK